MISEVTVSIEPGAVVWLDRQRNAELVITVGCIDASGTLALCLVVGTSAEKPRAVWTAVKLSCPAWVPA